MRKKMYWGITFLILIIGGVGVYFVLQPDPEPEKKFISPSEIENKQAKDLNQPQRPVSEAVKPPPPGASPNGHWHNGEWHNGEWHDESHGVEEVSNAKVSTDVQATPIVGQQTNTQIDAVILESVGRKLKNPEVHKAWVEWSEKHYELSKAFLQVSAFDVLPSTPEEEKRFETDEEYAREVRRKYSEAMQKSAKIYTMMIEHEKDNPLFQ